MTLSGNNTWKLTVGLTSGTTIQYKYDAYNNWSSASNWGDNNNDGIADLASGTNISYTPTSTGNYIFTFNDSTRAYSVVSASTSVEAPTYSPVAGAVPAGTTVTITSATPGSTIFYTTDGTSPSTSSSSGPAGTSKATVIVNSAMTIKAIGVKSGATTSNVTTAVYTIAVAQTPTFSPAGSAVTSGTDVIITSGTAGTTIYYTTNGTTPTTSSSAGPLNSATATVKVTSAVTIKAIAVKAGYTNSSLASASYTITTKIINQFSIIFKTGTTAENPSFPGDANGWNLTANQLSVGAGSTGTVVIPNGVTASAIAQGSSTTALELKLVTAANWNNQWNFSTWTLGTGITLTDSGRQITLSCTAGDQVDLTINVGTKTLSYVKK